MNNNTIKKILVPLDGSYNSWHGLDMTFSLARCCDASVTGMYSQSGAPQSEFAALDTAEEPPDEYAVEIMEKATATAKENGVKFDFRITRGDAGYNIVQIANNESFDLIVVGSRGRGYFRAVIFGSVTKYVLNATRIPVLIVR